MRTPNDIKLARSNADIDIILGGHDHVCEDHIINGIHIIKSGTDFRQFGLITIDTERNADNKLNTTFEAINVTSKYAEDPELKEILNGYSETIESHMEEVLSNSMFSATGGKRRSYLLNSVLFRYSATSQWN